jgi:hypothetical protein
MAIASTIFEETTHNKCGFHNPLETCQQARKININEKTISNAQEHPTSLISNVVGIIIASN